MDLRIKYFAHGAWRVSVRAWFIVRIYIYRPHRECGFWARVLGFLGAWGPRVGCFLWVLIVRLPRARRPAGFLGRLLRIVHRGAGGILILEWGIACTCRFCCICVPV